MSLPQTAAEHYRQQQRLTAAVVANTRRLWGQMDPADFDREWPATRSKLSILLSAGQAAAASSSDLYVTDVLEELDIEAPPVATVNPLAFAVSASDGRDLLAMLDGAIVTAKERGSLESGGAWLDMAVQTQIADASRGATSAAIAARPNVTGYVRMLNPPSCSRCTILAGRFYKWNAGFRRHPRCDCRHIPAAEDLANDLTTDPNTYFHSLGKADQDRIFTKAGAEAIREGADIGRVVNARRGMYRSTGGRRLTRSGTSRRRGQPPRVMPEDIFDQAKSREEAIEMLRRNGFIIDRRPTPRRTTPARVARIDESTYTGAPRHGMGDRVSTPEFKPGETAFDHIDPASGDWTPERRALHDRIVRDYFEGTSSQENPQLMFMGGGGGAGKTSAIRAGLIDVPPNGVTINADDLKELLPETKLMQQAGDSNWAAAAHEESSYLAKRVREAGVERRVNITMDAVGSDPTKVAAQVEQARSAGYITRASYVSIDPEEGVRRARKRFEDAVTRGEPGRQIPDNVVLNAHRGANDAFEPVGQLVNDAVLIDNSGATPVIVARVDGGDLTILNDDLWAEFQTRGFPG